MDDGLFATRLRWYGYSGIAKRNWHTVELAFLPQFLGFKIVSIDYIPEVVAIVQPLGQPERDMFDSERLAAERLLKEIA